MTWHCRRKISLEFIFTLEDFTSRNSSSLTDCNGIKFLFNIDGSILYAGFDIAFFIWVIEPDDDDESWRNEFDGDVVVVVLPILRVESARTGTGGRRWWSIDIIVLDLTFGGVLA